MDRKVKERQAGRTLVVKVNNNSFDVSSLNSLTGLKQLNEVKNNTVFLTFDDLTSATSAFDSLQTNKSLSCRYCYYRVFFKLNGLTESSTYKDVRERHVSWVEENTGGKVLEYNLYKNRDSFLNCGDLVVDLKSSLDLLLSLDNFKNYKLDGDLEGTYYRFNKRPRRNTSSYQSNSGV